MQPGELMLEMERVMPAPPAAVFAACTEPDALVEWFGPKGFAIPSVDFQARLGGRYRIEMQPPEGEPFWLAGELREVDPPVRLSYTFAWEDPDPDDVENVVGMWFRSLGDSTEVAFEQGPFKTEARRALHDDGWTDSFDKLSTFLSRRQSPM